MYYIASPFFNKFDIIVRDEMYNNLIKEYDPDDIYRPDMTEYSIEFDKNPSEDLTVKIFNDNIEHLNYSEYLVYPKYTTDLGTLFELGYFIGLGRYNKVLRYDYITGKFESIVYNDEKFFNIEEILNNSPNRLVIKLDKTSKAVLLGYLYAKDITNIDYELINNTDNIMLNRAFNKSYREMQ